MKKLTSWIKKTGFSHSIEKQCQDMREQIQRLQAERNDLQRDIDNAINMFAKTTQERELIIRAKARVQILNSYIKTAKIELRAINPIRE